MRIQLESTTRIVTVNGVPARVWEGETENGIAVFVCITRIAVRHEADQTQFQAEMQEHRAPSADAETAFPIRMLL